MIDFRICIGSRNAEAYTEECLRSILDQDYQRGEIAIDWTDDASPTMDFIDSDATAWARTVRSRYLGRWSDFLIQQNIERVGGLCNFVRAIRRADDDDVCVLMGGDDWLRPGALARIAEAYADPECWATYGEFENTNGKITNFWEAWDGGDVRPPQPSFMWCPLTVKAWLAKKVLEEDLKLAGSFFMSSGDGALNTPIVEMAGPEHLRWIREKWYVRRIHDGNDGNVDPNYHTYTAMRAYQKPRYSRLKDRNDTPTRTEHFLPYGLVILPHEKFPRIIDCTELKKDLDVNGIDTSGEFKSIDHIERERAKREKNV
jgi:glycosyltransferase involved in cell wall biosynthesis